jgi:hypothetical protein
LKDDVKVAVVDEGNEVVRQKKQRNTKGF